MKRRWELRNTTEKLVEKIATEVGVSKITAQLLVNRGIKNPAEGKEFFRLDLKYLLDPFLLYGMEKAIERLEIALEEKEKIVIFGDYDVDGITGTSLLMRVLSRLNAHVDYYIPDRSEGYGLNRAAVQRLAASGYQLLITVDNGISCFEEVELANSLGVDVIITDHHEPPAKLPRAAAIINPKLSACSYPFPLLAGVGVGFKLCQALAQERNSEDLTAYVLEQIDLVALGTVADIVPLLGENRIITAIGLEKIRGTTNVGLRELIKVAEVEDSEISTGTIGFVLGPRINAIGRLDNPMQGVELFTTTDLERAEQLAQKMDLTNRKRQMIEEKIFSEAVEMIEGDNLDQEAAIVLASTDWQPGVIGIVASKLVERYYRPTILIGIQEGIGKGSARGIRGIHLFQTLTDCQEHLLGFGGHEMAAGLSVEVDHIDAFRQAFIQRAGEVLSSTDLIPYLDIELEVDFPDLSFSLLDELEKLQPHGQGNPRPVLCVRRVKHQYRLVGSNNDHLKLRVFYQEKSLDAIGFRMADKVPELLEHSRIDLAFALDRNVWQGKESLQLMVKDLRPGQTLLGEKILARANCYRSPLPKSDEDLIRRKERLRREKEDFSTLFKMYQEDLGTAHKNESIKELQNALNDKENIWMAGWSEGDLLPTLLGYMAARALKASWISCILYPFSSLINDHYKLLQEYLGSLGIGLFRMNGSMTEEEEKDLKKRLQQGEVDIILALPEYLKKYLVKYKLLRDRIRLITFQEGEYYSDDQPLDWIQDLAKLQLAVITREEWPEEDLRLAQYLGVERKIRCREEQSQFQLMDQRENSKRVGYLDALLSKRESTIIYVNTLEKSIELTQKLAQNSEPGEILFYHEALSVEERREVLEAFQQGDIKTLVATIPPALIGRRIQVSHLVFYQMNFSHSEFLARCQWVKPKEMINSIQVHLLFGKAELEKNKFLLKYIAPDRDFLAEAFRFIQRLARKTGSFHLKKSDTRQQLQQAGYRGIPFVGFSTALEIFSELNLVEVHGLGNDKSIRLLPRPGQKLDLNSSIRYNEVGANKKAFIKFYKLAFGEGIEKLLPKTNSIEQDKLDMIEGG